MFQRVCAQLGQPSSRRSAAGVGLVAIGAAGVIQPSTHCHEDSSECGCRRRRPGEIETMLRSSSSKQSVDWDALPVYTSAQVAQRNGKANDDTPVWMSYGGFVYDVTRFIPLPAYATFSNPGTPANFE